MLLPLSPSPPPGKFLQLSSPLYPILPRLLPVAASSRAPLRTSPSNSPAVDRDPAPKSAVQRIADKLRALGYIEDDPEMDAARSGPGSAGEIFIPTPLELPKRRVGHTIDSSWSSPESPVPVPGSGPAFTRFHELRKETGMENGRTPPTPTPPMVAELVLPAQDLRRLRSLGIRLEKKFRLKVGKAGITEGIVNSIHERWRRSELVKIQCEDLCRMNMKRTHETLERKTGGLVIWRSGSIIILYRGTNYEYPYFIESESHPESTSRSATDEKVNSLVQGVGMPNKVRFQLPGEVELGEEVDRLLDGLGPRLVDWWGPGPPPVDSDLLPAIVSGYRRPFRLLPFGLNPKLTDREMTILRRLSRPLPCHFALGRNRNHQGLAQSMVKLWEKCEIAKIAIKPGARNTNTEMMAEELKRLTGGTVLSRNKDFIVLYRGKDFLPLAVSNAIEKRRKKEIFGEKQEIASNGLQINSGVKPSVDPSTFVKPGHDDSSSVDVDRIEERLGIEKRTENEVFGRKQENPSNGLDANVEVKPFVDRLTFIKSGDIDSASVNVDRLEAKLASALRKKEKAEKFLLELEESSESSSSDLDKEGISEEERFMLRKVGLRMKPFLLMGRRGVFDGTVENMHLHWKYRELVKIISKEKSIDAVKKDALELESASGGIIIAIERVSKGFAIIIYRGKNYRRPTVLRPRTLLNKKEALRRSLEAQRRQSLKLHVLKLSEDIDKMRHQLEDNDVKFDPNSSSRDLESSDTIFEGCTEVENTALEDNLDHKHNANSLYSTEYGDHDEDQDEDEDDDNNDDDDGDGDGDGDDDNDSNESSVSHSVPDEDHLFGVKKLTFSTHKSTLLEKMTKFSSATKPFRKLDALSNRERLILRKQALRMKKRPIFAIGRSNAIAGVARAIKAHFQKYPLAIVNVKGRAKGTSVQEVVFSLEQATGGLMVSREPSKIILYRGWQERERVSGEEGEEGNRENGAVEVSPQLMAAISFECGVPLGQDEENI